jgi:hypothetical protein
MSDAAPHLTGADYAHSVNVNHVSIDHIVCGLFVQAPLPTLPASGEGREGALSSQPMFYRQLFPVTTAMRPFCR